MRVHSYFNTALFIIRSYNAEIPLHHFLKQHFSQHKKHGSKDRKVITQLCYSFYRAGFALEDFSEEKKLLIAIFLCGEKNNILKDLFEEGWQDYLEKSLDERIGFIKEKYSQFSIEKIFPFTTYLSESVDEVLFARSFLIQPDVFLRIRNNDINEISARLKQSDILFERKSESCLALSAAVNIDTILETDKEVVVQDFSSQRIAEMLSIIKINKSNISIWDCCAASGGKSILANDILGTMSLTVSDLRLTILKNLANRFKKAGIFSYTSFIADLAKPGFIFKKNFDLVICDVPCTGSGTWSRTPEQLFWFDENKIVQYSSLQKKIISNTINAVSKGGFFLYITCSVFKDENEKNILFIQQNFSFQLIKEEFFKGYEIKADTMFAALFQRT